MPEAVPWYETFYGQDYLDFFGEELTPERAEDEAAFVQTALELTPGDEVLDLCCGPGRHTIALARRGLRMTGLDLSAGTWRCWQSAPAREVCRCRWSAATCERYRSWPDSMP